ncbi:MAG: radical SAM protein [Acutalibacteraceae bacterium]
MALKDKATAFVVKQGVRSLHKDFDKSAIKMIELAEKKYGDQPLYTKVLGGLKGALQRENYVWKDYLKSLAEETDPDVLEKLVMPILNAGVYSYETRKEAIAKYDCNIPWAILIDPTAACNLKCTGCWAAEYGHKSQLTNDDLDKIISEGKELGTYVYLFTGGEPLMRKKDLMRLCDNNPDCLFLAFTNGTLCDDAFADEVKRVGNMMLIFSIEGNEETTDARRGNGTYKAVTAAMKRLKDRGVIFGASLCYTKLNADVIGSDEYADFLIELGCRFAWYFSYMPIGNSAGNEIMATAEQRKMMYDQIRKWRHKERKPLFTIDFFNDGEYVGGCIAGGKQYFHINSNGDCEPCVFCHYSTVNIKDPDTHLIDVLRSPMFMAYRERQPFSNNHLRPCPIRDNPGAILHMVKTTGAASTDLASPEDVEHLVSKTMEFAKEWKPVADDIMAEHGFIKHRARSIDMYQTFEEEHVTDFDEFNDAVTE